MPLHGHGNAGYVIDALSETTAHLHTKSPVLNMEHKEQPEQPAKRCRSIGRDKGHFGMATVTERAIATPSGNTSSSDLSRATPHPSKAVSGKSTGEVVSHKDDGTSRSATWTSSNTARVPTLLQDFPAEPELRVDGGPEAGKDSADWRRKFIPALHEAFGEMATEERTRQFDRLVETNKDRYTTAIATYYSEYPEHIPSEDLHPPSEQKRQRWKQAFEGGSELYKPEQERVFKNWDWDNAGRENQPEPPRGPRDEPSPTERPPECQHCVKKSRKAIGRKALKSLIAPLAPPIRTLRRAASTTFPVKLRKPKELPPKETDPSASRANLALSETSSGSRVNHNSEKRLLTHTRREAILPEPADTESAEY